MNLKLAMVQNKYYLTQIMQEVFKLGYDKYIKFLNNKFMPVYLDISKRKSVVRKARV